MTMEKTAVEGAYVLHPLLYEDNRGYFLAAFVEEEWKAQGLNPVVKQQNVSFTKRAGTIRGLHYQIPPHAQAKVIRCPRGSAFDVILDCREDSPTYGKWAGVELSEENCAMLYIPEGCAHGFQTLCDDTEVSYLLSNLYDAPSERGVRYDDPDIAIAWPLPLSEISEKDISLPFFQP